MSAADAKADSKAADKTEGQPGDATKAETYRGEVEYDPLEKVEGEIKNRIAQQKVDERVAKAFALIESQMGRYQSAVEAEHAAELCLERLAASRFSRRTSRRWRRKTAWSIARPNSFRRKKRTTIWTSANRAGL